MPRLLEILDERGRGAVHFATALGQVEGQV